MSGRPFSEEAIPVDIVCINNIDAKLYSYKGCVPCVVGDDEKRNWWWPFSDKLHAVTCEIAIRCLNILLPHKN